MNTETPITTQAATIAQFSDYLNELFLQDLTRTTTRTYRRCLKRFQSWLEERPISTQMAKLFLADMRQQGLKPATIRLHYAAIRPFLQYHGIPLKLKLSHPHSLPHYHSTDEITAILQQTATRSDKWARLAERDTLMIFMLALTGMRRSELVKLTPKDISDNYLYIRNAKGNKDRTIPLAELLRAPLRLYIYNHRIASSQAIFPITANRLYMIIKRSAAAAGIPGITPHSFRHYFATYLLERGAPLKAIQQLLGHASIKTTAIYQDLIPRHLQATIALFDADRELSTALITINTTLYIPGNKNSNNTYLLITKGEKHAKRTTRTHDQRNHRQAPGHPQNSRDHRPIRLQPGP